MKFALEIKTEPITQVTITISIIAFSPGGLATIAVYLCTSSTGIASAVVLKVIIYISLRFAPRCLLCPAIYQKWGLFFLTMRLFRFGNISSPLLGLALPPVLSKVSPSPDLLILRSSTMIASSMFNKEILQLLRSSSLQTATPSLPIRTWILQSSKRVAPMPPFVL